MTAAIQLLEKLVAWEKFMGGFDSSLWRDAEALVASVKPGRTLTVTGDVVHDDGGSDAAYHLICDPADEVTPEKFCDVLLETLKDDTWLQEGTRPLPITELTLNLHIRINKETTKTTSGVARR